MVRLVFIVAALASFAMLAGGPASAQDGCKQVTSSCSAMFKSCEQNCNKVSNNASACIARVCSQPLEGCKANGVWRSVQSGSACWATKNRS
ncbi:hypothetical protein ACFPOB_28095 [Bosea eneae]|uniref:Uncharacterized protein n=1 Tax=Bosea eneae TaxID=151454 RepID=A0ABW0J1C3_9HYPH